MTTKSTQSCKSILSGIPVLIRPDYAGRKDKEDAVLRRSEEISPEAHKHLCEMNIDHREIVLSFVVNLIQEHFDNARGKANVSVKELLKRVKAAGIE